MAPSVTPNRTGACVGLLRPRLEKEVSMHREDECFGSIVQPNVTFTAEVNELSTDIRPALRAGGSGGGPNKNRPLKDEGHD